MLKISIFSNVLDFAVQKRERDAADLLWDMHEYFIKPMSFADKALFIFIIVAVVSLLSYITYRGILNIWKK